MADGSEKPIERIVVGDLVMAFDPAADHGRGGLRPGRVTRLFSNVTDSVFSLRGMQITGGHVTLDAEGRWRRIEDILATDRRIVLADGSIVEIAAERIVYSDATAHIYEQAERVVYPTVGGAALAPKIERGWKTYNFEVEDYHTYIAGGVRVHNDSVSDFTGFLSELGVADGQLTQAAYDSIAAEFGSNTARLAAYGGVGGVKALADEIAQNDALAQQAHDAGDFQAEAAFKGQADSLRQAFASASADLSGSLADLAAGHPNVAQFVVQQAQANGVLGAAMTYETQSDGSVIGYGANGYISSLKTSNGDGTSTTEIFGTNSAGVTVNLGSTVADSAGHVLSTTINALDSTGALSASKTTFADNSSIQTGYAADADGNAYLQTMVEKDATGAIVSTTSAQADGSAVVTDFSGGKAVGATAYNSDGVVTREITYAADGSATIDLLDADGMVTGTLNVDSARNVISVVTFDEDANIVYRQVNDASGKASSVQDAQGLSLSQIVGSLGSTIGNFLGGNSLVNRIVDSTLISTAGSEITRLLASGDSFETALTAYFGGSTLLDAGIVDGAAALGNSSFLGAVDNGIGSGLSSLLIAEADKALGLHGLGAAVFNSIAGPVSSTITTTLVTNIVKAALGSTALTDINLFAGFKPYDLLSNIEGSIGGALGSYLANLLVPATSQGGSVGGQLGSSLAGLAAAAASAAPGTVVGGATGGALYAAASSAANELLGETVGALVGDVIPIVGPFIGALVGGLVGTAIGNLVDPSKPLSVSIVMGVGPVTIDGVTRNGFIPVASGAWGGNTANQMAALQDQLAYMSAIGAIANVVDPIAWMTGGTMTGLGGAGDVTFQQYGSNVITTTAGGTWDWISAYGVNNAAWERAVNEDALSSLEYLDLKGGDPIMTAALAASTRLDNDIASIATDMEVAKDYETYLANTQLINETIAANPDSVFAAGWIATLARVEELGLNKIDTASGLTADLTVDGGGNAHEAIYNSAGVLQEDVYFNRDGTQKDYQYYINETASGAFDSIDVPDGGTAVSSQIGVEITAGGHANVTSSGDYGLVTVDGDVTTVAISGANSVVAATGNGNTINAGAGVSIKVQGGATVTQQTTSESFVYSYGFYVPVAFTSSQSVDETDVVNGSGDQISIGATSQVAVNGSNDAIIAGSNANVSVTGASDTISFNGSGGKITIGGNGASGPGDIVYMSNGSGNVLQNSHVDFVGASDAITVAANSTVGVNGDNNQMTASGADSIRIAGGAGNTISASGSQLYVSSNVSAAVNGNSDTITLGSNDTLVANGSSETINVNGAADTVTVTGAIINLAANASAAVGGNSNTFALATGASLSTTGTGLTIATAAGSNVSLGAASAATVAGSNGAIAVAAGGNVAVTGSAETVSVTGSGATISIGGNGVSGADNIVYMSGGTGIVSQNSHADFVGSNDTITVASNATIGVNGSDNKLTVNGADSICINGGLRNTVSASSSQLYVASNASVTVNGNSDTINLSSNDTLAANGSSELINVNGTGDIASATNATINLAAGASLTLSGDGNVMSGGVGASAVTAGTHENITVGTNSTVSVTGNSETVNAGAGSTVSVTNTAAQTIGPYILWNGSLAPYANSVVLSGGAVNVGAGSTMNVTGANNVITVASNDNVTVSGSSNAVTVTGVGNTISMSSGTLFMATGAGAILNGPSNSVTMSSNDTLSVSGTSGPIKINGVGNSVSATGAVITLAANASATVNGNSNAFNLASGGTVTVTGTPGSITIGGTGDTLNVSSATIALAAGLAATVNGNSNTISVAGGASLTAAGTSLTISESANGKVNLGSNATATINAVNAAIAIAASSTVAITGSGDAVAVSGTGDTLTVASGTVSLLVGASATVNGNADTFVLASNASLTASGSSETVNVNGTSDSVSVANAAVNFGANASATVAGNSNVFTLASNDTLTVSGSSETIKINGTGDTVSATSAAINLSTGASAAVAGDSNTVSGGANVGLTLTGTGEAATVGSGSTVTATGNSEKITAGAGSTVNVTGGVVQTVVAGYVWMWGYPFPIYTTQDLSNTVTLSGGNINTGSGSTLNISGSNDNIALKGSTATVSGNNENFVFHASFGQDVINGVNSTDTFQFDKAVFADWAHLMAATSQSGSDTIITLDAADTITLKNVTAASLTQSQFHFV